MTRQILFWIHLCIGVVAGAAILIMSATGVLLAFERQVLQLVDRDLRTVNAPADTPPRRLGEMLATVSASAGSLPSGVVVRPSASASVEFTFGRDRSVYLDPYTGAVLGEGSKPARESRSRDGPYMCLAGRALDQAPAAAPQGAAPSFKPPTFADDTLTYVFGPDYRNPFITTPAQPDGADIARNTIEFKHVDAWKYGHNFVEVIIKKSSGVEPAAGGGTGALGLYSIFRSGVGINRVAGGRSSPSARFGTSTSRPA